MTPPLFRQLFDRDTWTYTYLLADSESARAVIIDPVFEQTERDLALLADLGLRLITVLDTHIHADHITGAAALRKNTGASYALGAASALPCADRLLDDGDTVPFGSHELRVLATPGHTDESICFALPGRVFTGDTLFIRGTGRTDFQNGSTTELWDSITTKLFTLPDDTRVYPAHDYKGHSVSTIAEEKAHNPRVGGGRTFEQFAEIVESAQQGKPLPSRVKVALPANGQCGEHD